MEKLAECNGLQETRTCSVLETNLECLQWDPVPLMHSYANDANMTVTRWWFCFHISSYLSMFNPYLVGRLPSWPNIWSNYSDLTRPHSKWWFSRGNLLISGKSRLVKYYNLARNIVLKGLKPQGRNSCFLGQFSIEVWPFVEDTVRSWPVFLTWVECPVIGRNLRFSLTSMDAK